jgi:hypothetical protein
LAFDARKAAAKVDPRLFLLPHTACHLPPFLTGGGLWRIEAAPMREQNAFKVMSPSDMFQMHRNSSFKNSLMFFFKEYLYRDTIKM